MGSIVDFASLKTAVYNWTDRTPTGVNANADPSYEQRVEDGIMLFEAYFNRKVRTRDMVTTTTLTTSGGSCTLPTDMLAVRDLVWTGSPPNALDEVEDSEFEVKYAWNTQTSETPQVYLIRGNTLLTNPNDDTSNIFTLVYYQKIPALTASNTTNWLITNYPDVYLFGTLTEMTAFAKDAQTAILWKARRDEVCNELILSGQFYRGPAPAVNPTGPTP